MIFIDIETLPTNDESVIAELRKSITAPAQYKKQDSIDKWMEENAEDQLKELIAKTSFDGLYGRIACIAWALDDGDIMHTKKEMNERECLSMFFDYLDDAFTMDESLCGHNIVGFDLPFLKHRSIINKIKPPITLLNAMSAKPWDNVIQDTMLLWSTDKHRRGSMDRLCKAFGIKGKEGFDGSMVAETWPVNPQKVIDYCCDDIRRTREIYKRITFQVPRQISKRLEAARLEAAIKAENMRIAEQQAAIKKAEEKRQADLKHRDAVKNEAINSLNKLISDYDLCKKIISAIENGDINHVGINF